MKHIVACVPFAREFIYCPFFMSWSSMLAYAFTYAYEKYTLSLVTCHGPYIDANRDTLITKAKTLEPDAVLFLDDDQTYPPDTPEILLNHDKLVVGGVTPRKMTYTPMIWDYDGRVKFWNSLNGQKGLTKVTGMGMGGVLIRSEVFDKLESPYFKKHDKPTYQEHGEDMAFYFRCRDAGIDVWTDLDLQYGHMVMKEARLER